VREEIRATHREWVGEDWLKVEQRADAIQGNLARRSLICRAGAMPAYRAAPAEAIERLWVRGAAAPEQGIGDVRGPKPLAMRLRGGAVIHIAEPTAKLMLAAVARHWPKAISFDQLLATMRDELQLGEGYAAGGTSERAVLRDALRAAYVTTLVDLHAGEPAWSAFVPAVSAKPRATALARLQAREMKPVANLLHFGMTSLNTVDRFLLAHANGERDRAAMAAVLRAAMARRLLPDPTSQPNEAYAAGLNGPMEQSVEASVQKLAANALFEG
jgi:hypothetical protein